MVNKIFVFNAGSYTIKISLFEDSKKLFEKKFDRLKTKEDYRKAISKIRDILKTIDFDIIIHRVVHGGNLKNPARINSKIKRIIKNFSKFSPLHNEKELMIINFCEKNFPKKRQYAVFDTMFFVNLPKVSSTYPIPKELIEKYKIKKYGFHGLSHKSISRGLDGKTITIHLGQGASMTAIKNGKAIDTSMGLTPLEGLMMMTRSGSVDSGLVIFLQKQGYNTEVILNEKSGFKGLTNLSDFRDVIKNLKKKEVKLAYEIFTYSIIKYIGAYAAVLDGLDNLVFSGAIGEGSWKIRKDICKHLDFLGVKLDEKKNKNQKNQEIISSANSKVKVYVKQSREDEEMIREVLKIL